MSSTGNHIQALAADTFKVDERSTVDQLSFAANYARLINYYDQTNSVNGNWSNFLLKDPLILMAAISKLDYNHYCSQFFYIIGQLQKQLNNKEDCHWYLEQAFELILSLFSEIESWVEHIQIDKQNYQLKSFILDNVKNNLAEQFSAFVQLQKKVFSLYSVQTCIPPSLLKAFLNSSDTFLPRLELDNEDGNLNHKLIQTFQKVFDQVFSFYVQVIDYAKEEFETIRQKVNEYPDTALLISFVQLLKVHQNEINRLTERHLKFYYEDILKQKPLDSEPDSALIYLTLKKNTNPIALPEGTPFLAGTYPDKSPILFTSVKTQEINHIQIPALQNLLYTKTGSALAKSLFLSENKKPGKLNKGQHGEILSSPLFGSQETQIKHAFAVASPSLYLSSGERKIDLQMAFDSEVNSKLLSKCTFLLSTQKKWLDVTASTQSVAVSPEVKSKTLQLCILLDTSAPAIEPFKKNPDGLPTLWPILKVIISDDLDLTKAIEIQSLCINTEVSDFKNVELLNSSAKLNPAKPFTPFGPQSNCGDIFYIGSQEIFCKPTSNVSITINWQPQPPKFEDYYKKYNDYLLEQKVDSTQLLKKENFTVTPALLSQNCWQKSEPSHLFGLKPKALAISADKLLWLVDDSGKVSTYDSTRGTLTSKGLLGNWPLLSLAFDPKGTLWCISESGQIGTYNNENNSMDAIQHSSAENFIDITFDSANNLWFVDQKGRIGQFNSENGQVQIVKDTEEHIAVSCSFASDGTLWLVNSQGLFCNFNTTSKNLKALDSVINWHLKFCCFAEDKVLWCINDKFNIGTTDASITLISDFGLLGGQAINCAVIGSDDNLVECVTQAGLHLLYNKTTKAPQILETLAGISIKWIAMNSKGQLNYLTSSYSVGIYDASTASFSNYLNLDTTAFDIISIAIDQQDTLWLVNKDGSLWSYVFSFSTIVGIPSSHGTPGGWALKSIAFDKHNIMWCVSQSGKLGRFDAYNNTMIDYGYPGGWKLTSILFHKGTLLCIDVSGNMGSYEFIQSFETIGNDSQFNFEITQSGSPDLLSNSLDFTDDQETGFFKIELTGPDFGFGSSIYSKVATDLAMKNAQTALDAAQQNSSNNNSSSTQAAKLISTLPNKPYIPEAKSVTVNYKSSLTVDMTAGNTYPFEFYHYNSFSAFKVFDSTEGAQLQNEAPGQTASGVKLYPTVSEGTLFIELANVEAPCNLSLYFELAETAKASNSACSFYYLSVSGWKKLPVLADSTGNFSYSGLVEVQIPQDISMASPLMPQGIWLAITSTLPQQHAALVCLNTQGLKVQRIIPESFPVGEKPRIAAKHIKAPQYKIAEIASTSQLFPSFDGTAKECRTLMRQRVSHRLNHKDRAWTPADYESLAFTAYAELFYSKCLNDKGKVTLALLKKYHSPEEPNAFKPVINSRYLQEIQDFFTDKTPPSTGFEVVNFKQNQVFLSVTLTLKDHDCELQTFQKIAQMLKLYLSPWISCSQEQMNLDKGLSRTYLSLFIDKIPEVLQIVSLKIYIDGNQKPVPASQDIILPDDKQTIFVSAPEHSVQAPLAKAVAS